eukprot:CAMPEP_0169425090 /NCGR_PEP_ID=MMETSP1017-20121227/68381_1 /TAXON_ID=342587 /ORGANISM="Karlodinium micrum, Strain CCMP2283" /LENGTH=577 /DNA_ID=CAMNT_0009534903 /DNA_START=198 /DNA_END=1928 /DNA_ORIENTATION=-
MFADAWIWVLVVAAVLLALAGLYVYDLRKNKKGPRKHIDGLELHTYTPLAQTNDEGATKLANSQDTSKLDLESNKEQPAAPQPSTKSAWSLFSCGCARPKGRLQRKPAAVKMQRSAGATRSAPRVIDFSKADPKKWNFTEVQYDGKYTFYDGKQPEKKEVNGEIENGIKHLKENPGTFDGIYFQSNMKTFPKDQQKYTLVKRTGSGFAVTPSKGGAFTWIPAVYDALSPEEPAAKDKYTDSVLSKAKSKTLKKALYPGRGQGIADMPGLKIIGDVDPSDVSQGGIGDCWLLSAISAMAEYHGAIDALFKKTPDLKKMPKDGANSYTVTLYDLPSGNPVDIIVDERLCSEDGKALLASKPSVDGELWVCYLEKAVAAHCGGWDKIDGGTCTHGWRLLTGAREQYTIRDDGEGFKCFGDFNPNTKQWEKQGNSPADGFKGLWPMEWPKVGGGGGMDQKITPTELFERMCKWDDENYLMGCGSKAGSDKQNTDGIVDGHAYTILQCIDNAGGSKFDMIKVRNPWGKGEFSVGKWDDNGPGWKEHPEVKAACKPVQADDGIFWMDSDEFFKYFHTIYLCCQ